MTAADALWLGTQWRASSNAVSTQVTVVDARTLRLTLYHAGQRREAEVTADSTPHAVFAQWNELAWELLIKPQMQMVKK